MGEKDSKENFTRFTLLMTKEQKRDLDIFCATRCTSMSDFVREAIRDKVKQISDEKRRAW